MHARDAKRASTAPIHWGGWIWSPRLDLGVFGGSALLALLLVAFNHVLDWQTDPFPEWAWLFLVLGVDVAHVYATLFRTYLDVTELKRHPFRYFGLPALLYAGGVVLFYCGNAAFWRGLAYLAVWHFVRQQIGWVRVYRARSGARARMDVWIDELAIYAATLVPVFVWHSELNATRFHWFISGDFVDWQTALRPALPWVWGFWALALGTFCARQVHVFRKTRLLYAGKLLLVASTALLWWLGIVGTNSDFDFTATNVLTHGVPYVCLLWIYARAQVQVGVKSAGAQVATAGLAAFVGLLWALALLEEFAWARGVYHDHAWLFGARAFLLPISFHMLVVPLLALPQITHYVLDGVLWRRSESAGNEAQLRALGFRPESD